MQNAECSPVKWRADFTGQGVQNENSRLNGSHSPFFLLPSAFTLLSPEEISSRMAWSVSAAGIRVGLALTF